VVMGAPPRLPQVLLHRALVCTMAVALLWSTSLSVSQYLTGLFVAVPPVNEVVGVCRHTYSEVHRQKAAHSSCAARQMDQCDRRLAAQMDAEARRSRQSAEANRATVRVAVQMKQECASQQMATLGAVERLQQAGVALVWTRDESACSADERERAQAVVGDIGVVRDRALSLASGYTRDVQLLQALAFSGIDARIEYDAGYFERKTSALHQLPHELQSIAQQQGEALRAALRSLNRSISLCGDGPCELPLQPQLEQMRSQVELLKTALAQQQHEMASYQRAVQSTVEAIGPQLTRIKGAVAQFAPDLSGALPSMELPHLELPTVSLEPLPSAAELQQSLRAFELHRQAEVQQYLREASNSTTSLQVAIAGAAARVPQLTDYDPPPVNTSDARARLTSRSTAFLDEQAAALAAVSRVNPHANASRSSWNRSAAFSLEGLSEALSSRVPFEPLVGTTIDVDFITLAIHNVAWAAMVCDFVWRAYRSVRIIAKYWGRASVGLPLIDMREDADMTAALCGGLGASPTKVLGALFLSPLTGLFIISGALLLLVNLATALYWPTYLHYVHGCITPPRNGTVLSENVYSVSYNYAASHGNEQLAKRMDHFHSVRAANCSAELRDSMREQRAAADELIDAIEARRQGAYDLLLLRKCLDAEAFDVEARRLMPHSQPWVSFSLQLAPGPCDVGLEAAPMRLQPAVFNCSALDNCDHTCHGPSREVTHEFCQSCGCHAEWLVHGILLQLLLAILVFTSINTSRVVFVESCCRNGANSIPPESRATEVRYSIPYERSSAHEAVLIMLQRWPVVGYFGGGCTAGNWNLQRIVTCMAT